MKIVNHYLEQLMKEVLKRSQDADWLLAVMEWHVDKVEEDKTHSTSCVCGKERLRWLYTIRNDITGSEMFPIGSRCIKRFGRPDLNADAALKLELFKLLRAVENKRFIKLSPELFSRKLLLYLYRLGAFKANADKRFDPKENYKFMLEMFNKGSKRDAYEQRKTAAIILQSIKPFLQGMLREKARRKVDTFDSKPPLRFPYSPIER